MLQLLGAPAVLNAEGDVLSGFPSGGFLVAAYLARKPGTSASRVELQNLFWGDVATAKSQMNLRQTLSLVRKFEQSHGIRVLQSDSKTVRLADAATVDLVRLLGGLEDFGADEIVDLLKMDNATFLHGLSPRSARAQGWLEAERNAVQMHLAGLALKAAQHKSDSDQIRIHSALLAADPYVEEVFCAYASALARQGDRATIAIEWEHFCARLWNDLNIEPATETSKHVEELIGPRVQPQLREGAMPRHITGMGQVDRIDLHRPRLMVLPPPEDGTARPAELYVVRSFVEDVVDSLATLRSFDVVAPHSARKVAQAPDLSERIGHVDFVVSCRLAGKHEGLAAPELTIRLTEQATGRVMFADRFSVSAELLSRRYRDVLKATANALVSEIERDQLSQFRTTGVANAYLYFLMAKDKFRPYDLRSVRATRRGFQKALNLDQGFMPAKSLLARTLTEEWFLLARTDKTRLTESLELANQVVDEAPLFAGGHWERASSLLYLGDIDAAVTSAEKARDLAPHEADLLRTHADMLVHACEFRRARDEIDRAMQLNPLAPDDYHWIKATAQFLSGDNAGALDSLRLSADWRATARLRAVCHALMGDRQKARKWRQRYLREYPDFQVSDWQSVVPMKSPEVREYYTDALRLAGFV